VLVRLCEQTVFVPPLEQLGLSTAVLARRFSGALAAVTLLTFAAYAAWTAAVVEWRIRLRKRLARLDNARAAFLVDSLSGTEAVQLVGAEAAELSRFDCFLRSIAGTTVRSTELASLLNAGQALIFGAGLLSAMLLAADGHRMGRLSIGDVVAVNGLLLQLARPMDFIGYTFSEIRQSLVDMDAMLRMLATPTAEEPPTAQEPPARDSSPLAPAASVALEAGEAGVTSEGAMPPPLTPPSVVFEQVSYAYPNASMPALVNASFAAPAGGTTALVREIRSTAGPLRPRPLSSSDGACAGVRLCAIACVCLCVRAGGPFRQRQVDVPAAALPLVRRRQRRGALVGARRARHQPHCASRAHLLRCAAACAVRRHLAMERRAWGARRERCRRRSCHRSGGTRPERCAAA
jgi:hypothetical protein